MSDAVKEFEKFAAILTCVGFKEAELRLSFQRPASIGHLQSGGEH